MWTQHDPYEARTDKERRRNLARLGTRWQEKPRRPLTERERQWEDKMDMGRARDAYHAQTLLWVLVPLVLFVLLAWLSGCAELGHKTALLYGCDPVAMETGYCHVPKPAQK